MPRNCRAGLRFMILYFSKSFLWTSIAALEADSIRAYIKEMSSKYRTMRMPSVPILRLGSACKCVNPSKRKTVLISLCQSCGACLSPYRAFMSITMIGGAGVSWWLCGQLSGNTI